MKTCFWYVVEPLLSFFFFFFFFMRGGGRTLIAYFKTPDYPDPTEGFWREFFLLPPDKPQLQLILDKLSPDDLLALQVPGPSSLLRLNTTF